MDSPNGQDGFLLFFKKTGETGAEYPLSKGETTIGADDDADVRIKIDTRIEIIHCTIHVNEDGRATIKNLSESNPIKVNNNLVRNTRKLCHNDMIQVVTKKFQYKKSLIENENTKTNRKSLTPFKKSTKKSPTFKTKAVTPRIQAVSSSSSKLFPVALPFRAKSRLSLHMPTNTSNKYVTNSKMESLIPQLKITPWKNTSRKSSVKEIQPKKSIGNRASSLSKKSLTRRSRNKLASDESEKLRMSSCSSYSPLNRSLSREISSEDENIFLSVPKEKTPIQRRSIKSKSETKVLPTNTRKSSTYSTTKHSSTTKKYSSSAKKIKDLSDRQNASPIKGISARKSVHNTAVVSPRARKSLKFNKSEPVTFEFSGLEEEIFARSQLSAQLDSTDTDDSISDIKNVSARQSSKNRSRKSLNISQPKSEINTSAMEKYPSSSRVSSPVKSIRTPVGRNSTKSNKSSTDFSMSPLQVSSLTKSGEINQSKIEDFNNSDFEINFSPTRVSSTRKSAVVRKSAAMNQSSKSNLSQRKSGWSTNVNQSGDESMETTEFEEIVSLEISSISRKSTKGNKSMKELSKRSGDVSEFLNTSSTLSEIVDVSPAKASMNKSLQSNVSRRSAKTNLSQVQVEMLSPTRVPTRKSIKTPKSTKDGNQSSEEDLNISGVSSVGSLKISPRKSIRDIKTPNSAQTNKSITMDVDTSEINNVFSRISPRKSLKSHISRQSTKINLEENRPFENPEGENFTKTRLSSPRKSIKSPKFGRNNQSTDDDLDISEIENASPTRVSLQRKTATPAARNSTKINYSLVVLNSEMNDNLSPVRPSSARKSLKSSSLNRDKTLASSDVEEYSSPARNSLRKGTKTPSSTKANQSTHEPLNSSVNTSISSTRASLKEKHSISGSRRSEKAGQSLNVSLSSSEVEDNLSPVKPSSARKSLKSRSLNRDKSLGSSDVEEYISPARNSLRKSTKTPSSTKANQSTHEPLNSSVNTSISSTRASLTEKLSISGSRRSRKTGHALNESLSSSEVEDNLSPVKSSSARKSLKSRSSNQDESLGNSDIGKYDSPTRNTSRKSIKTPSSTKVNQSTSTSVSPRRSRKTNQSLNLSLSSSEVDDNVSPVRVSSSRNTSRKSIKTPSSTKVNQSTSTIVSPRRSRKTNQSLNESLNSSEVDDNVSPVRVSSSRKSIKTLGSVKDKSGIKSTRSDIEANLSRSAKRSKSMNQSVDSLDTSISSISSVTMSESEELNNARFSSTRKSASKSQRSVSCQPESDLGTSFTSLDISNIEYNQSSVEAYSVSPLKSTRKPITPRSAVKLDHIYSRRTKSISNISISTEDNDLNVSSLSSILNNSQTRKSSRARKSTVENDFDYSSSSRKRRDSETGSGVYSLCSTIPAEALDVSVTTSRISSNIADESTLENVSYSLDTSIISSRRSRTTEASVVDLTTPPSPKRNRKSSVQYQPITEDITPVTPLANTKDEAGFKTPQNTPHVFENIRKSVLKSRSRHEAVSRRVSAGNDSIGKNVLNAGEGVKRPRESTGSARSNKRMKLSTNEANSSIDSSFSSFDSEVFEADTPKLAAKNISVHQPDFSSRFSSEPQRKKSAVVRRSLQIVTNVENSKPVSTPPVSKKISQKGPKNDLSDVEGVKTLMKTPKTHKEPENDLSNVSGVKNLLKTPKIHKEPKNDLTNVAGVKKLLKTPKVQKEPKNDLSNIAGVKKLLKTPKAQNEPKNDLTNVAGVKKLLNTPKVQKEPKNDLSNVAGIKKLLKTPKPQNEPNNDLRNVSGVKKLLKTPKVQKEPENNLINIPSFKKLFSPTKEAKSPKNDLTSVPNLRRIMSPKQQNTPKNDLTDIRGLKKLMKTPKETKGPLNDLTDVRGLKKLMRTPRTQKEPLNDLSDLDGVANIFSTSVHHRLSNTSDIENNEDLFNKLFDRKPLKTYRSKSTSPIKNLDAFGAVRKTIGDHPVVSPRVVDWIDEQKVLKERQAEISKPQSVQKGRKKTRVDELKDEVVPKKVKTRTKRLNSDGVQVATISSTRTKVSSESEEDHRSEVSTEELDTYTSEEVKTTRTNRQRNENKTIEPPTEVIESPQSRTRGRKGKIDVKTEGLDSVEEKNKIDIDSPKPRRGRRNITKVDDEPAVESPQTSTRSRRRVAAQVDVHDEKPATRTRNAKNDEPKTISLDSPLKSVATDKSTESPKITTKGRRKATTKDNEPEEEEHETHVDSPKVTARGRRNKKVESIATDSPQGKSGRNKSKEDQEKPVDSPKVVARGRRNAKVVENDITSDVAQEKSGRNKSKEVMEETVDSPKVAVRGRRNAAKKVEEEAVVETVDSPKVPARGRRAAKKIDNDVVSVESPKPKAKRNKRDKSTESTEELSKDVDSPKIETKKTTKSAIAEEKLVQDSPKKTRGRLRGGVAVENIQEELPTGSKDKNTDSPSKTEPTTKGKRGRGKKQDEIKKVDTHEVEKETEPANSPTKTIKDKRGRGKKQDEIKKVDTHEVEKETEPANSPTKTIKGKRGRGKKQDEITKEDTHETEKQTPNSPTKTKKDADTVKSTRGKRKQKEETEDVSEAVVPVAKRSKKGTPAEVTTDNEEKESSTTTKRTRRGKYEVEKEDEPEVESKRNKKVTDADQKQSSKRKDEAGTKKSKRGKVEEIEVEEPPASVRSTRARGKRVQFID